MKLLDILTILAIMFMLLFVSMHQERDIERLEKRIETIESYKDSFNHRLNMLEQPELVRKQYKQNKGTK